ncbi:MAG: ATP-binding protein [Sphingomonas sp.]|nr:ATP-binding protein [Sphingomonas sp.]
MNLFSDIDLPRRFRHQLPEPVTRAIVSAACLGTVFVVRFGLDLITPGAAPFALVFPAVMMATLFAGLRAGLATAIIALVSAWYFIMPFPNSFAFVDPAGPSILTVVALACLITLAVAHVFREAVVRAQAEREQQIADRDLFLSEFDHRVKNNFAIVISLLELQRRRADPKTAEALTMALTRVEGISRAHQHLYRGASNQPGAIQISSYLTELCTALHDSLSLARGIVIDCQSCLAQISRDRAVSLGLVVNELVTNAAKHAFPDRENGKITVRFSAIADGWRLAVADNGVGTQATQSASNRRGGLGTKLVDAFARQAGGQLTVESDATGTRATLELAA